MDRTDIPELMLERQFTPNFLSAAVTKILVSAFEPLQSIDEFTSLNENDFIRITLGTYQLKQTRSYLQLHLRENNGEFPA